MCNSSEEISKIDTNKFLYMGYLFYYDNITLNVTKSTGCFKTERVIMFTEKKFVNLLNDTISFSKEPTENSFVEVQVKNSMLIITKYNHFNRKPHHGNNNPSNDEKSKLALYTLISSLDKELEEIKDNLPMLALLSISNNIKNIIKAMALAKFKATENPTIYSGLKWNIFNSYVNDNLINLTALLSDSNVNEWVTKGGGIDMTNRIYSGCSFNFKNLVTSTVENNSSTVNAVSDDLNQKYFTVVWNGYFMPNVSGVWKFRVESDDCSYVWLNSDSQAPITNFEEYDPLNLDACGITLSSINNTNALINNGGIHPVSHKEESSTFTAGVLYPIIVMYGQNTGGDTFLMKITDPNGLEFNTDCAYILGNKVSN